MRPTGVLTGGPAPTVRSNEVTLYFVSADGALVRRTRVITGEFTIASPLQALLTGPNEQERADGLTTELPITTAPVEFRDTLVVVPIDTGSLTGSGYAQLSCTATSAGLRVAGTKPGFACDG